MKIYQNQLLQLCTARIAWSDSVFRSASISVFMFVVTKCWPMETRLPCGDQWKAEKLGAFWRWLITRRFIKSDRAGLFIAHSINFRLDGEHWWAMQYEYHNDNFYIPGFTETSIIKLQFLFSKVTVLVLCTSSDGGLFLYPVSWKYIWRLIRCRVDTTFILVISKGAQFGKKCKWNYDFFFFIIFRCTSSGDTLYLYQVSWKYSWRYYSYRMDKIFIWNNSVKI